MNPHFEATADDTHFVEPLFSWGHFRALLPGTPSQELDFTVGEGLDVANGLGFGDQHDQAIEAEGDAR